jgi:transposase-like protein
VLVGQGKNVPEVCKEIEISQQTYYRWRMDYNHYRPHSSLDYMAPAAFAAKCLEQGSATLRLPQDKENVCEILS